jgi:CPA1 family monovalent cation:H+ antiporter
LRVPYPALLVIGGLLLGFVPGLEPIHIEPDLVLLVFLPPLLYFAAYSTPLRDFRANKRAIGLLAIGLPLFTTVVVAVVAQNLIPGLPLAAAFALGAIVSPPDAIAATAVLHRLAVPRRLVTVLEGESLVNDATALVLYGAAIAAWETGRFVPAEQGLRFVVVAAGGIAIGVVAATVWSHLYRRLDSPLVEVALSLLIPFSAYLPAERLHVSGVLAVVTAGLILGRRAPTILSSTVRVLGGSTWQILTFLLNGFAFILIGVQLPEVLASLSGFAPLDLLGLAAAIAATVVVARFVWVYPATYLPRFLSPSLRARDPYPPLGVPTVVAWAGMRGAVSLAAALALPPEFPHRNLILLLTFGVILVTLVGQGLTLPALIGRLGLSDDGVGGREENVARSAVAQAALAEIQRLRPRWQTHAELLDQLEAGYRHRTEHLPDPEAQEPEEDQELVEHREIRQSILAAERTALITLRDRSVINDEALRKVERDLDLEELRMEA